MATGRSDFPNQVNNVLGFPFIFRGALDVHATTINEEMKLAATYALAALAKEDVPDSVCRAYGVERLKFGRDYIIPKPFDPRVLVWEATAVAKAAMDSGVARIPIDLDRISRATGEAAGQGARTDAHHDSQGEGESQASGLPGRLAREDSSRLPRAAGREDRHPRTSGTRRRRAEGGGRIGHFSRGRMIVEPERSSLRTKNTCRNSTACGSVAGVTLAARTSR